MACEPLLVGEHSLQTQKAKPCGINFVQQNVKGSKQMRVRIHGFHVCLFQSSSFLPLWNLDQALSSMDCFVYSRLKVLFAFGQERIWIMIEKQMFWVSMTLEHHQVLADLDLGQWQWIKTSNRWYRSQNSKITIAGTTSPAHKAVISGHIAPFVSEESTESTDSPLFLPKMPWPTRRNSNRCWAEGEKKLKREVPFTPRIGVGVLMRWPGEWEGQGFL